MKAIKPICLFCLIGSALTLCGCNNPSTVIDTSKTQIYLHRFAGGFGEAYLNRMIEEWNAKNDKYQIVATAANLDSDADDLTALQTGTNIDIFWSSFCRYETGWYHEPNYFEDLSEILDSKPDGENGLTVREKIIDKNAWLGDATARHGEGCYMLPNTSTIMGFLFDYDAFMENGWLEYAPVSEKAKVEADGIICHEEDGKLIFDSSTRENCFYQKGDIITIASHDGIYGTYDDGQPVTMDDFRSMLTLIDASGYTPIGYSGKDEGYIGVMGEMYFAQTIGLDTLHSYLTFNSNGQNMTFVDASGTETQAPLTIQNGYQAFSLKGYNETVDYAENIFFGNYTSDYCRTGSTTVDDLQQKFVMNDAITDKKTKFAMLVEGNWFESEARSAIENVARHNPAHGYGKQRYRLMLTPTDEHTTSEKSVVSAIETGGLLVKKQSDPDKKAAIFDFIKSTLTNDNLAKTCVESGLIRPYSFTLTSDQLAAQTPFQRYCYTLVHDHEHVETITPRLERLSAPITFASSSLNLSNVMLFGRNRNSLLSAMRVESAEELKANTKSMYTAEQWANGIAECQRQGFYQN